MCGRYGRRGDKQKIAETFHLKNVPTEIVVAPSYNIAPTTFQPIIRNSKESGDRELVLMQWGMVPYFAKSRADFKGFSTINAKAESLMTKAMWKRPFQRHRCIVPAEWFYEWKVLDPKNKQPYAFAMNDDAMFGFAGLWDAWKDPQTEQWLQTYTIITTDPNELTSTVHDRMPVILHPRDYEEWLTRDDSRLPPIHLLRPYEADAMKKFAVSKDVGNVRNNHPELLNSA